MTEIIESGGGQKLPTYAPIEEFAANLARVRLAIAVEREPSVDLLHRVDEAIETASRLRNEISLAARPAPQGIVAAYLGLLLKAYGTSTMRDDRVFGRLMRDDVCSLSPPVAAVEIACRRWRRRSRFLPAISEMYEEVKVAKSEIEMAESFIAKLPEHRARIAISLEVERS